MPIADSELAPIFPPIWKRGDRFRIGMTTETEMSKLAGGKTREFEELVFDASVAEVPADERGLYRLDMVANEPGEPRRFHAYYRARPFSFARLASFDRGREETVVEQRTPYPEREEWSRFLTDFPVMPDPPRLGETSYLLPDSTLRIVQKVERRGDTLLFTITHAHFLITTMEWKRGAPWWSSLSRAFPDFPGRPARLPTYDGSGRLLER